MHKYERIRDVLQHRIANLPADSRLPDERELANQFDVSRATVRQALRALLDDNKIYSVRGRGTFVAARRIAKGLQLSSFTQDMVNRGLVPGTRLLVADELEASTTVARILEVAEASPVYYLERLRLADGYPMCFEMVWLPSRIFPALLTNDLEQSLYWLFSDRYSLYIDRADQTISAEVMTDRVSELLSLPVPSAGVVVTRRGLDNKGRVAEFGKSIYRGDRYDFNVAIER